MAKTKTEGGTAASPTATKKRKSESLPASPKDKVMKSSVEELYVGNIPYGSTETEYRAIFSEFGKVDNLDWKVKDGHFRGYCYLTYSTDEEKDKAIAGLNNLEKNGRTLICHVAPVQEEKVNPPSKTLYIGNLPKDTTEAEVKEKFSEFGPVLGVRFVYARGGEFKKCAFLDFNDQETATKAKEAEISLNENQLVVNYSNPKDSPKSSKDGDKSPKAGGSPRGGRGSPRGGGRGSPRGGDRGGRGGFRGGRGSPRGGDRGGRGGFRGGSGSPRGGSRGSRGGFRGGRGRG